MTAFRLLGAAFACAFVLTACGGGDERAAAHDSAQGGRAAAASVAAVTANDLILYVSPDVSNDANIVVKNAAGTTQPLPLPGGGNVSSLDQLPAGIANHPWVTNPASATGHLRIRFKDGIYRFTQGWVWPISASGHDAGRQIILERDTTQQTMGEVSLQGSIARSVSYAQGAGNVTLNTSIPQPFEQLWPNDGKRLIRARQPNAGQFYYVRAGAGGWPDQDVGPAVVGAIDGAPVGLQAFQADDAGYNALSAVLSGNDSANAVVVLMNKWQASKHRVKAIDPVGKRVRLTTPLFDSTDKTWYIGRGGLAQRYFLENRLSYVDSPDEWFWSGGTLTYRPSNTAQAGTAFFEVPQVQKLLLMTGNIAQGKWIQYVQFSKLRFRYAKLDMPAAGYINRQADTDRAAAIELNDARDVRFVDCEVSHTGGYGIWLNDHVKNVTIEGSELYDLGAGGVKIGKHRETTEFNQVDTNDRLNADTTGMNVVQSNRIHSIGHVYPGSVGVWIGRSSNNLILGNLIRDTTYSGVSVGWVWEYNANSFAQYNVVTGNFLEDIGQGALADMGGIYLLGKSPNTQVESNVVKNVTGYKYYGESVRGIYLDQASAEISVTRNLVYGVEGEGLLLHFGELNEAHANTFANVTRAFGVARRMPLSQTQTSANTPITLTYNNFYPTSNDMVAIFQTDIITRADNSSPWTWTNPAPSFTGNQVSGQLSGGAVTIPSLCVGCTVDGSSTVTDPGPFKRPITDNGNDYTDIHEWVATDIKPAASPSRLWKDCATARPSRWIDFQAAQWPLLTNTSIFEFPVRGSAQVAPVMSIRDDAVTNVRYLAMTDESRTANFHEPFVLTDVSYPAGSAATVRFKASFDAKADFVHAWRSDETGTKTGPNIRFVADATGTKILLQLANGSPVTQVDVNTWHTYEIKTSSIGGSTSWTLKVDGIQFGPYSPRNNDWTLFKFAMFSSNANNDTVNKLAFIEIKNQ